MSANNSEPASDAAAGQPTMRRLKLTMPSPDRCQKVEQWQPDHVAQSNVGPSTPPRPTWSPVTPTLPQTSLPFGNTEHQADASGVFHSVEYIDQPEPLPLSLDENTDAIAVQAAISILQLQKQQSLRDIRALSKIKMAALDEPEAFADELRAGKLHPKSGSLIGLDEDDSGSEGKDMNEEGKEIGSRFGQFPSAQNVIRCPPINWDKYHVVGDSLDRLHEEQKRNPGLTDAKIENSAKPPGHAIIAPYRPFVDRLDDEPS